MQFLLFLIPTTIVLGKANLILAHCAASLAKMKNVMSTHTTQTLIKVPRSFFYYLPMNRCALCTDIRFDGAAYRPLKPLCNNSTIHFC